MRANLAGLSPACRAAASGSAPPNAAAKPSPAPGSAPARQNVREATPSQAATATAPGAATGKPTAAQTAAIRSACRSDFMVNCSGVQPGGPAALQCLQINVTKLSQTCPTAIAAVSGSAPAGAAPSPTTAEAPLVAPLRPGGFVPLQIRLVVLRICRADVVALCGEITAGRRPNHHLPCRKRSQPLAGLLRGCRPCQPLKAIATGTVVARDVSCRALADDLLLNQILSGNSKVSISRR